MMTVSPALTSLVGKWQGKNSLWLSPDEPVRESAATAVCQTVAQGKFFQLNYTWADEGKPQAGMLLLGQIQEQLEATWVDSWHMQDKMMTCTGTAAANAPLSVLGYYAAPPGPDWGWRLTVQPENNDQFRFLMYNITPEGEEMLAVEAIFSREA